jgi:hypothetical protein
VRDGWTAGRLTTDGTPFAPPPAPQITKARIFTRFKQIDNGITDAANEAKDNVKYLMTLDKYIAPLYGGTPLDIIDTLPGLLNNIRMMHTIARYYSTAQRMTTLFRKITDQMIANCRQSVEGKGSLWDQPTSELIKALQQSLDTNRTYQEQYRLTRDKLAENPKGKQFDFNENVIFGKFDLYGRRVEKLIDMFSTVEQFTVLSKHNLEGMDGLMSNFFGIVADFKRKPYELLDFSMNQAPSANPNPNPNPNPSPNPNLNPSPNPNPSANPNPNHNPNPSPNPSPNPNPNPNPSSTATTSSSTPTSTSSRARCRASSTPPSSTSAPPSTRSRS